MHIRDYEGTQPTQCNALLSSNALARNRLLAKLGEVVAAQSCCDKCVTIGDDASRLSWLRAG